MVDTTARFVAKPFKTQRKQNGFGRRSLRSALSELQGTTRSGILIERFDAKPFKSQRKQNDSGSCSLRSVLLELQGTTRSAILIERFDAKPFKEQRKQSDCNTGARAARARSAPPVIRYFHPVLDYGQLLVRNSFRNRSVSVGF